MPGIIVKISERAQAEMSGGRALLMAMCHACKCVGSIDLMTISDTEALEWVCAKGSPQACAAACQKGG